MKTLLRPLLIILTALGLANTAAFAGPFDWENLQSDIAGVAEQKDPNVVNPWGLTLSESGRIWVADNGNGVATVYYQDGTPFPNSTNPLVVNTATTAPTGDVSNGTNGFKITKNTTTAPAKIIFVGEDGIISGYNQNVDSTNAQPAVTNPGAIYKGVTIGSSGNKTYLYVTNFNSGQVETYDSNFAPVAFPFVDPNLPAGYAPFGIRNFNNKIYVTFVPKDPNKPSDELAGPGNGLIDVFNTNGQFVKRLVTGGRLNAPWGLSWVSGNLWVGNFGDGRINAYNPGNGNFVGTPKDVFNAPLDFEGLWDLLLTNNGLFFTAGIADEDHGIFGAIFND